MTLPFYTVGHSTRTLETFVALLDVAQVNLVVDVRTVPKSRTNPHYNEDALPQSLAGFQIGYERIAALGGLRGRATNTPPELNGFWQNQSFHNYADYTLSPAFEAGLDRLLAVGREQRCAIMCSEAVWWRCHRRIVADHLIIRGESVFHLMGRNLIIPASLTVGARLQANGQLTYPTPAI